MIIKNPNEYVFDRFEVSHLPTKKYNAVLVNKRTGKEVRVPFGAVGHEHYRDKALGVFSQYDHGDLKRRDAYRRRHRDEYKRKYSSGWFSWYFLWS